MSVLHIISPYLFYWNSILSVIAGASILASAVGLYMANIIAHVSSDIENIIAADQAWRVKYKHFKSNQF